MEAFSPSTSEKFYLDGLNPSFDIFQVLLPSAYLVGLYQLHRVQASGSSGNKAKLRMPTSSRVNVRALASMNSGIYRFETGCDAAVLNTANTFSVWFAAIE